MVEDLGGVPSLVVCVMDVWRVTLESVLFCVKLEKNVICWARKAIFRSGSETEFVGVGRLKAESVVVAVVVILYTELMYPEYMLLLPAGCISTPPVI